MIPVKKLKISLHGDKKIILKNDLSCDAKQIENKKMSIDIKRVIEKHFELRSY